MFSEFSKDLGRKTEALSAYLPDRDLPIREGIEQREKALHALDQKLEARQGLIMQNDGHGAQQGDDPLAGPAMEL